MRGEEYLKSRLERVGYLRDLAQRWLAAGDPDKSGGPSYWRELEDRLKAGIAAGCLSEDPEDRALERAFQDFKQQMWKRAGEYLLKAAQGAVDDARKECAEVELICKELDGSK